MEVPGQMRPIHWCFVFMVCIGAAQVADDSVFAEEKRSQEIWEYSPYRVRVWLSVSPTLSMGPESIQELHRKIVDFADLHFGAACTVEVESTPDALFGSVLYRLDELTVEQLLARELIMVVGKSEEAKQAFLAMNPAPPEIPVDPNKPTKALGPKERQAQADLEALFASLQSVRTLDSAIERVQHVGVRPLQFSALQRDISPYQNEKKWADLQRIVQPFEGTNDEMQTQLGSGKLVAALIQKMDWDKFKKVSRQIPTRLPWQPEALLRENDKIFLASIDKVGEAIRIQVKELDSFVRRMGELSIVEVVHKYEIARSVAELAREAFTPVVRIEETDFKTALLRVRAAGLMMRDDHPLRVSTGDVLLPMIRRDDSNGNPIVLQTIPFTFVAITEQIDSISRFYGAIFSASRGSLTSAKNRRTQRVGLRIQPLHTHSDLKLAIRRNTGNVVSGAEIYRRTPGSEDLQFVGRTDWRGMLPIGIDDLPTIQYEPPADSKVLSIGKARQLTLAPVPAPEYRVPGVDELARVDGPATAEPTKMEPLAQETATAKPLSNEPTNEAVETDGPPKKAAKPAGFIKLHVPLYLYYVKNGETLLARLPIVDGLRQIEVAEMPDDRRRLEAEAFLKGLQGEMLDIVVRKKILEARVRDMIRKNKLDEAEKYLLELKRVKSYDRMSEQIEGIERRALTSERGAIVPMISKRIGSMLDTTRQLMQKYLQEPTVRTLEVEIANAK